MSAMLEILLQCLAEVVGGLIAAAVVGSLVWQIFKLIRRPEWGGPIVVLAIFLAARGIPHSPFLQMMTFFLTIASVITWQEGGAWRRRSKLHRMFDVPHRSPRDRQA